MNRYERLARRSVKSLTGLGDARHEMVGPRILIYHQVGTELGREMEVTVDSFAAQMEHVQRLRPSSLDDALGELSNRLVVTFDDGYSDTRSTAFPLLREWRIPFVLYLATSSIETGNPLTPLGAQPLTWDEIGEMLDSGLMTVGAHTHTHLDLRSASMAQVEDEIAASDDLFDRRLGLVARHFAYPWGFWGAAADRAIRARYESAVLGGHPSPTFDDRFRLNRIPIQSTDSYRGFLGKLKHGGRSEERLRRILKGYDGP